MEKKKNGKEEFLFLIECIFEIFRLHSFIEGFKHADEPCNLQIISQDIITLCTFLKCSIHL